MMDLKNKKIGVLLGGLSKERDVSLRSGTAVAKALRAKGYDIVEIDAVRDVAERLRSEKIDVAFLVLHGRYGEDGTMQGLLEILGIPYTGSGPLPSAIGMDKDLTKKLVAPLGVRTPAWRVITRKEIESGKISYSEIVTDLLRTISPRVGVRGAPEAPPMTMVVKPNREGSTIGISIVREERGFAPALQEAASLDEVILIEQFVSGVEVTVSVVNGRALPVVEIVPKSGFYDYASKYTKGATDYIVPARVPDAVRDRLQRNSEKIWNLLGLAGFARMDYIVTSDEEFFLEVNTIPGMTETSLVPKAAAAAGISFEDLCEEVLKGASLKL